ncbi:hypothetical protein CAEBREN_02491 [Caenorhabditis brenneri]|uniref:SH3 domain-containing protein n=1 Tax=Caenorhabditis brenneri TaxID=135651 RepID=G0N6B4_CAEBE|nr:hypothetical protein CAEBREN_02491 [Caenorhabditis brenneri]
MFTFNVLFYKNIRILASLLMFLRKVEPIALRYHKSSQRETVNRRQIHSNWLEGSNQIGIVGIFPASYVELYRAVYPYQPQKDDGLQLFTNDIIFVVERCDDGWYIGTSLRTGEFGIFPGNYVKRH